MRRWPGRSCGVRRVRTRRTARCRSARSTKTRADPAPPSRSTKNKSQNLVIKNASRHFVQNHESEEDQVQLIQQIQQQQQRLQSKKLPVKKLNTYKPQQVVRMTDSYNSASNVKRGPPLVTA